MTYITFVLDDPAPVDFVVVVGVGNRVRDLVDWWIVEPLDVLLFLKVNV